MSKYLDTCRHPSTSRLVRSVDLELRTFGKSVRDLAHPLLLTHYGYALHFSGCRLVPMLVQ